METNDQRQHRRFPRKLSVDVHVFVLPHSQADPGFEAKGRTLDIGRGGVKLRLDKAVHAGGQVRLRFWELPPGVRLWPLMISGTILRMEGDAEPADLGMIGAGTLITVEFTEPLKELEIPGDAPTP